MSEAPRFVVVDDDKFNNALCTMVIAKIWKDAEVLTFHDSQSGFDYLVQEYPSMTNQKPQILLLDINMPLMDGWEFLDKFNLAMAQKNEPIDGRLVIYVLSSSVDKKDIDKSRLYKNVTDYIIKPITKDTIRKIIGE